MNINVTDIALKTNNQIVDICHKSTAIPSILIMYFSAISLLGLFGTTVNNESKKTFLKIWIYFTILLGVITVLIIYLPNSLVQPITDFFIKLFN
ncbi:MAG: hypothetical protein ACP6IY_09665 [Promethearchaeia archaeon]